MTSEHDGAIARGVRLFFKGLGTIIPIALTVAIVVWLAGFAERGIGSVIKLVLPEDWYITGMGLVGGIVLVIAIGLFLAGYYFVRG